MAEKRQVEIRNQNVLFLGQTLVCDLLNTSPRMVKSYINEFDLHASDDEKKELMNATHQWYVTLHHRLWR